MTTFEPVIQKVETSKKEAMETVSPLRALLQQQAH